MSFRVIEHTADVGIHAEGKDLSEAFGETARGMFSLITELDDVEAVGEYKIELEEEGWDDLLVAFLSELIYLHEVKDVLFSQFDIVLSENEKKKLEATASGESIDFDKHKLLTEIKAVSYHEMKVDEDGEVKVIFDV